MRHPSRYLREYVDAELPPRRQAAIEAHLSRCLTCRAAVAQERRLRSRLRALRTPPAGADLREKILLGVSAQHEARLRPGPRISRGPDLTEGAGIPVDVALDPRRDRRAVFLAVGALAAAGAAVLGGAYLTGSLLDVPQGSTSTADLASTWSDVAGGAGNELTGGQIARLRAQGWVCPELQQLGMTLDAARAVRIAGRPAVEMTLTGEAGDITVYEQRPLASENGHPVLNAVTGRPVTDDGFERRQTRMGPEQWTDPERPGVWVLAARNVTYTLESRHADSPLAQAVSEVSMAESTRFVDPGNTARDEAMERIRRGLTVLTRGGVLP